MPGQVAVVHPGTQHSWQTALALEDLDRLAFYATSIFYRPDRWPFVLERLPAIGPRLAAKFRRFSHPTLDPARVRTAGVHEWLERIASGLGWNGAARRLDARGNDRFGRRAAEWLAASEARAVWGYNGSSLSLFASPAARDRCKILDRTTPDHRAFNAIMGELAQTYPEFLVGRPAVDARQIERDDREYELADRIVAGSAYSAETVRLHARSHVADKLRVIEYCYDEGLFGNLLEPAAPPLDRPIRFLFVGLASARKGIHHVLEAMARLPRSAASLTVVGKLDVPPATFARYTERIDYAAPIARAEVPALMARHHVLLFPTYSDGGGIVLYEALAAGCALIQSDRAAIAVTPETGILLDTLSTDALHAAMLAAIEDRPRLAGWRAAAQAAARRNSFARYREAVAALLDELGV